ncbi:MAG: redox-regulated ATPase YchF [Deltaproteobacteria bacterium]|nr:redox-regulated ATPase YchF [Deltaproteobacteria bacterium]
MRVGLVGFKSSGKTTVFNALTGQKAEVGGYAAGKVNLGVIKVPDPRVDALSEICKPEKTTYAEVTFADVPGFEAGKGLDSSALTHLRDVDAFAHVVRAFGDAPAAARDIRDLEVELVLADLAVVEKRLERLKKEKGKPGEKELLEKVGAKLSAETPLRAAGLSADEEKALSSFAFLSQRPMLYVLNVSEADAGKAAGQEVVAAAASAPVVVLSGRAEMEIAELAPDEQTAFLADLGLGEPARARFIRACYSLLDLISMFTVGEDEVKAWTIHRGDHARKAAGKIHTDIERGFIRAEVIRYEDYVTYKTEARCREVGKLRLEGKDYVVQDGDVVHFRFNV